MKFAKTLIATALFATAALSQAAIITTPTATGFDFASDSANFSKSVLHAPGSFADKFTFSISNSNVLSSATSFEVGALSSITGGVVNFFKVGNATALATLNLQGTKNTFSLQNLGYGSYFYTVTGKATGLAGGAYNLSQTVAPVPEPETYALMGMGLVGLLAARRRKAKQA